MRELAEVYRALGDETRLKMLWLLTNHDEMCVCDFLEILAITQSKASRHLRYLYHAGLVEARKDGPWSYYCFQEPDEPARRALFTALRKSLALTAEGGELLLRAREWLGRKQAEACR
jgi:ArsR family transcriptional regulator